MAGDEMEIDDPVQYNTYYNTPSRGYFQSQAAPPLEPTSTTTLYQLNDSANHCPIKKAVSVRDHNYSTPVLRSSKPAIKPLFSESPPSAGRKRSHSEYEAGQTTHDQPAQRRYPKESHYAEDPPVQRFIKRIGRGIGSAAKTTALWGFGYIARAIGYVMQTDAANVPEEDVAVVQIGNKRRAVTVSIMPGAFPDSATNKNAAVAVPQQAVPPTTAPQKVVTPPKASQKDIAPAKAPQKADASIKAPQVSQTSPTELSPFSKACQLKPAVPVIPAQHTAITVMPAQHNTTAIPQRTEAEPAVDAITARSQQIARERKALAAEKEKEKQKQKPKKAPGSAPTPPDSRPSSSQSNSSQNSRPASSQSNSSQNSRPSSSRSHDKFCEMSFVTGVPNLVPKTRPKVKKQKVEPTPVNKHLPSAARPAPAKSSLKKEDNDKDINELIERAKRTVIVASPPDRSVYGTLKKVYAKRVQDNWNQVISYRDDQEERDYQEAQRLQQEKIRAAQEAKERKAKAAEVEKQRLQAEAEASERAVQEELKAERRRRREEEKKQKAEEAEARRVTHDEGITAEREAMKGYGGSNLDDSFVVEQSRINNLISTISADWAEKVYQKMESRNPRQLVVTSPTGVELTRKDFGTLLPQEGSTDDPSGWLNDEMVNGFVDTIVTSKKDQTGFKKTQSTPAAYESYASGWYTTYQKDGIQGLSRWSKRKKLQGGNLLKCEKIFFPINTGSHWMLLIISPQARTIEFLDSLHSRGQQKKFFRIAREWLEMELDAKYDPTEWKELDSKSETQLNSNDCGVFTCFNALASAKKMGFEWVDANRMPAARNLMAAVLLKGSLSGEFML